MTQNNITPNQSIEELPPSDIDTFIRRRVNGTSSTQSKATEPTIIDTGTAKLESPTVQDIVAQREDNPFLRLAVIAGFMGVLGLFLFTIFAIISPKAPSEVAEKTETTEDVAEENTDYQAKLAFRDQLHSLEKKAPVEEAALPAVEEPLLPAPIPTPVPPPKPVVQSRPRSAPRPIPRPTVPRPVPQVQPKPAEPKIEPQQQWNTLANFGTSVSSRSVVAGNQPRVIAKRRGVKNEAPPALLVNNSQPVSQGELGILSRRKQSSFPQASPALTLNRAITKGKIELPLVWDSSLPSNQQQSNQITVVLDEAIYDLNDEVVFEEGSVAIIQVDSINPGNGLVTAYVTQINDYTFKPGELILRNKKKSALVAKASKRSDFGGRLLVGGVDTLSGFGQQLLIPETSTTVSNGSTIVSGQSRNSIGRDLAGSALDGFGSSISTELNQRSTRNQIGDGGTIFTLSQGMTVYLTNIQPIQVNP